MRNVIHDHGHHPGLTAMRRSIATISGGFSDDFQPLSRPAAPGSFHVGNILLSDRKSDNGDE